MRELIVRGLKAAANAAGYTIWKRSGLHYGLSVYEDVNRLSTLLDRPVATVFDVGANQGQSCRKMLDLFRSARVYAFEPHPKTFERLAALNHARVSPFNLALGDREGEAILHEYGAEGLESLVNSLSPNAPFAARHGWKSREIKVRCVTLDTFCTEHDVAQIDLLKIDTEGFDLFVLKGAHQLLSDGRIGFVYVEFNDLLPQPGSAGGALLPIAEYLSPFGFKFIASYTDYVLTEGDLFVCANALFAVPAMG